MKDHPVVRAIENHETLDGETKLLALAEIDLMNQLGYANFQRDKSPDLSFLFMWNETQLGFDFWVKLSRLGL